MNHKGRPTDKPLPSLLLGTRWTAQGDPDQPLSLLLPWLKWTAWEAAETSGNDSHSVGAPAGIHRRNRKGKQFQIVRCHSNNTSQGVVRDESTLGLMIKTHGIEAGWAAPQPLFSRFSFSFSSVLSYFVFLSICLFVFSGCGYFCFLYLFLCLFSFSFIIRSLTFLFVLFYSSSISSIVSLDFMIISCQ